jgi:hypothetical protein
MTPIDALYQAVHDYPGGAPALAPRMGLAASTLLSFANPNCESHRWPLARALQVVAITGDMRPIEAICAEAGGVFVGLGDLGNIADGRLLKMVSRLLTEFGDVPRELHKVLADGRVKPREAAGFRRQVYELQQAAAALARLVDRLCDQGIVVPESERPE